MIECERCGNKIDEFVYGVPRKGDRHIQVCKACCKELTLTRTEGPKQ